MQKITLSQLHQIILKDGIVDHPYPSYEYVQRNRLKPQDSLFESLCRKFDRNAATKKDPTRELIFHWVHQGLEVEGLDPHDPLSPLEQAQVERQALHDFLLENGYPIPSGLRGQKQDRPSRDDLPHDLDLLITAYRRFWGQHVDRDDPHSYPKNQDVQDWLEQQGISSKSATEAARIVRPDWAPSGGRRPK